MSAFHHTSRARRAADAALATVFCAALCAPAIDGLAHDRAARIPIVEKRRAAVMPARPRTLVESAAFPPFFQAWFDDHLGLREPLLRANHALSLGLFDRSPRKLLVPGERGWFFYGEEQSIETWRGLVPFRADELAAWKRSLRERAAWCAARGIRFVFAIAPNKESVYPEHFPARFTRVGPSRLDQLAAALADVPHLSFVDLRRALDAEKAFDREDDHVFHRLGTHWTERGAWAGARALLAAIDAPGALATTRTSAAEDGTLARERFETRLDPHAAQDSMGESLYMGDALREPIWRFEPRDGRRARAIDPPRHAPKGTSAFAGGEPDGPSIVLVHDSFGPWLTPFLAEEASRLVATASSPRCGTVIADEAPEVLVQMYTERVLVRAASTRVLWGETVFARETLPAPFFALRGAEELVRALAPVGGARVVLDGADAVRVELESVGSALELALAFATPGGEIALEVEIETAANARLEVFAVDEAGSAGSRLAALLLAPDAQRTSLRLGDLRGVRALRLALAPGSFRMRSLALHVAR